MFSQTMVTSVPLPRGTSTVRTIISPASDGSSDSNCVTHTIRSLGISFAKRPWKLSVRSELLPRADWIVISCPLTRETRNLIDAAAFSRMKKGARLINIARGEVVDEAALADALGGARLRCAYLDVFTTEPLAVASPLWALPNVLISPHNAGGSTGTYARGVEIFLRNLDAYLRGRPLENEAA